LGLVENVETSTLSARLAASMAGAPKLIALHAVGLAAVVGRSVMIIGGSLVATLVGCAVSIDRDQALTAVPYSVQPTGRIHVDVQLNGQGPFRFVVDSAATSSFVFAGTSDAIGLAPVPGVTASVYGAVASGRFPVIELESLAVGDVVWTRPRVVALPEETIATARVDGVLGLNFLRRYAVGFDVREETLRLYRPETIADRSYEGWSVIRLRSQRFGNAVEPLQFLEIEIAGNSVPALFDLGSGISVLNTPAARRLALSPIRREESGEFAGALGSQPLIAQLRTQDVETGRIRWRNESFLIADPGIFATLDYADRPLALLGSALFAQRDFIIDLARNRLLIRDAMSELEPADAPATPVAPGAGL
jgi:predicted aspartyl protease